MKSIEEEIAERHRKACEKGEDTYIDPLSGYLVFTEDYHRRRGSCCQSRCRHCPWEFAKRQDEESD